MGVSGVTDCSKNVPGNFDMHYIYLVYSYCVILFYKLFDILQITFGHLIPKPIDLDI